jgi:hypothetical protein
VIAMTAHSVDDETLAFAFLAGIVEEKDGVVSHRYFEKGSEIEAGAQAALVRLLRGDQPLSDAIRWRLAGLFDPKATDERQLKIVNRRRGPQKITAALSLEIALYIAGQYVKDGTKLESAKEAAAKRFNVALRTATRAWAENKDGPMVQTMLHGGHTVN